MNALNRLTLVLLLVATASVASLATLVLSSRGSESIAQTTGLRTVRPGEPVAAQAAPPASGGPFQISSYAFIDPPAKRGEESRWTVGFFVANTETRKVKNCIYMWGGAPMNRCVDYGWVEFP